MIQWLKKLFGKKAKPVAPVVDIIEPQTSIVLVPAPAPAFNRVDRSAMRTHTVHTPEMQMLREKYQRPVVPQPTRQYETASRIPAYKANREHVVRYHDEVQYHRRDDSSTDLLLAAVVMNSLSSHADSPAPMPELDRQVPVYQCAAPSPSYEAPAPSPSYESSSYSSSSDSYSSSDSSSSYDSGSSSSSWD